MLCFAFDFSRLKNGHEAQNDLDRKNYCIRRRIYDAIHDILINVYTYKYTLKTYIIHRYYTYNSTTYVYIQIILLLVLSYYYLNFLIFVINNPSKLFIFCVNKLILFININ